MIQILHCIAFLRIVVSSFTLLFHSLLSQSEIKAIVKKRTVLEYAVHRRINKKSDYLRYIEYETNLDRLRRKRKARLGLDLKPADRDVSSTIDQNNSNNNNHRKGITLSDYSITRRIHNLYQKALTKFPADIPLWTQYFAWAKQSGSSKALGISFAK